MRGVWHTGDCGKGGAGFAGLAEGFGQIMVYIGAAVLAVNFVMWIFHFLIDALTITGLLAMVGCGLWVRLKWKRWQMTPQGQPQPVRGRRQAPPVTAPVQPQAIPAATVHNHYGHTLVLQDAEDVAKVFGRREG